MYRPCVSIQVLKDYFLGTKLSFFANHQKNMTNIPSHRVKIEEVQYLLKFRKQKHTQSLNATYSIVDNEEYEFDTMTHNRMKEIIWLISRLLKTVWCICHCMFYT